MLKCVRKENWKGLNVGKKASKSPKCGRTNNWKGLNVRVYVGGGIFKKVQMYEKTLKIWKAQIWDKGKMKRHKCRKEQTEKVHMCI